MSSFTEGLYTEMYPDGEKFRLLEPFSYYLEDDNDNVITVPANYVTDFASIPRSLTWLIPKMGKHSKASLIHDYLYDNPQMLTRKECDKIFLEAMKVSGVKYRYRMAMYYAVRIGGSKRFKRV